MITVAAALGFLVALLPIILTPGASFTLVTGRALIGDRRGAVAVIGGTSLGILTHAVLAGLGLAALVMASAQAFAVVRLVGALVMIGLGVQLLWQASRARATVVEQPGTAPPALPAWSTLVKAYGANVLNVKAAAVYLTLAPQFLTADQAGVPSMIALGLLHIAIQVTWLTLCILGWSTLVRRVDPARWRRRVDALGGLVLVALGIRSAVTTR